MGGKPDQGLTVFDLFEAAERMIEARLRRENPAVTQAEIRAAIDEWASGGDRHLDADGYLREIPVPPHWIAEGDALRGEDAVRAFRND